MTILPCVRTTSVVSSSTGRHHVDVTCDEATLSDLLRLAEPFLAVTPAGDRDGRPRPAVLALTAAPEGRGWTRVAYSSPYEPDRVLWAHRSSRTVAVCGDPSPWRTQQLLRCVRNLLRWEHFADGELFLHGGLVQVGGRGIAFVGGKRSGKTSSILSALLHGGADFVSNDDLVVSDGDGPGLRGLGFPRSVNVRTDSLLALAEGWPALRGLLRGATHPANSFPGLHHEQRTAVGPDPSVPPMVWVRCQELAEVTGSRLLASGTLDAVVFPAFVDSADGQAVRRLSPAEARTALADHSERAALSYDPFLADWYPDSRTDRRAAITDTLVSSVPCYRLTQDMHHLGAATEALLDTVLDGERVTTGHDHSQDPA
ncbi:hypothetical protein [Umezawaea sp.]|uniref:hypothetical protein n=1 Tax=Umezawaea sp. TaxID=1955258 RepID=UPI002ED4501E